MENGIVTGNSMMGDKGWNYVGNSRAASYTPGVPALWPSVSMDRSHMNLLIYSV